MSDREASLQPTTVYGPSTGQPQASSSDGPHPPIDLVAGTAPRFSDETTALLRRRLKAASLILAVVVSIAVIKNLLLSGATATVALQAAGLLSLYAAYFAVRSGLALSLFQLRSIELLMFGGLFLAVALAEWLELRRFADTGDFDPVIVIRFFASFAILILTYGMLMPNTWQRAGAILFPVACIPFAVMWSTLSNRMAIALEFEPLPIAAAILAVFGTHVINSTRQMAFNARQFRQYRLKEKLGDGGMGEVYRAEHLLLKRSCVIKLLRSARPKIGFEVVHIGSCAV